jgi:ELWxxDGT repeat protein
MARVFYNLVDASLWVTDGAPSSDHEVMPFGAFPTAWNTLGDGVSAQATFTAFNNALFFGIGAQLWKSDGTAAGTQLVKDFGTTGHVFGNLTPVGSTLFFTADDGTHGDQLWETDGTPGGTVMLTSGNLGFPDSLINFGSNSLFGNIGPLFFAANGALWNSDGTPGGTVPFASFSATGPEQLITVTAEITIGHLFPELFFVAQPPSGGSVGLWEYPSRFRGRTPTNYRLIRTTSPASAASCSSFPSTLLTCRHHSCGEPTETGSSRSPPSCAGMGPPPIAPST